MEMRVPATPWAQRTHRKIAIVAAALAVASAAASCASAQPATGATYPAWFAEKAKSLDAKGFPKLSAIPRASGPGRSAAAWSTLGAELRAEGAQILASPRNVPADLKDLESFEAEARRAVTPPPAQGTPLSSAPAQAAPPKAP